MKKFKEIIFTEDAPAPIGAYSQAIKINHPNVNNIIYISGQIPKDVKTQKMVADNFKKEAQMVFSNLAAVAAAAGGDLSHIVKLTIFLTDLDLFADVNAVMQEFFSEPYPARSTVEVSKLPAGARVEIEAVMYLGE